MQMLFVFFFGILGAIIGSFLNVVVLRLGSGMTLAGRSKCFSCGTQLRWFELIPLLSYSTLRGHCRSCGSGISLQYPLVEGSAALLFGLVAWQMYYSFFPITGSLSLYPSIPLSLLHLTFWSLLITIAVYDLRHKVIPDILVYPLGVVSLAALSLATLANHETGAFLASFGAGVCSGAFFLLLYLATRGRGVGLGDAKLAVPIAWFVGFPGSVDVLLFSFWIGALVGIALLLSARLPFRGRRAAGTISMKTEVPFAPFLVLAAVLVSFFGVSVVPFF